LGFEECGSTKTRLPDEAEERTAANVRWLCNVKGLRIDEPNMGRSPETLAEYIAPLREFTE
jgi:hypothetical protein